MTERQHIPLGVGFYPDWFYTNYGISFGRDYYFDPETRIRARMVIEKCLHERFGDVGLGNPNPGPKPLITFGMVMLPAVFGCEIVFKDDALPWAMPLNLSEKEIMKLKVPDLFHTPPMSDMIKQIEYLRSKYGKVVGDINTTGVQNLALKLRGDNFYFDYFERPELCHHLLRVCTETMIQLFRFNHKTTGTGAVDVTPMCDPTFYVLPNCTIEQVSLETYESFLLQYDNMIADECHPLGIHHCGSVNEALPGYAKVRHLAFLEIGFGSDVMKTRQMLGPEVAVNARINPVLMKNGTPAEVASEVRRLIDSGAPLENFSIDTVGLTYGTPDENVRTALVTAAEYGKIRSDNTSFKSKKSLSFPSPSGPARTLLRGRSVEVAIERGGPLVIIGERINPTGRKKLAAAIEKGDLSVLIHEAEIQLQAGAKILDVNVGVSGIDEPRVLREAVRAIQVMTDMPLCIDSANPQALDAALEVYVGTPLINSVNGEKHKLDQILPLVKKYNASVIALTMDDSGIPKEAEGRLKIAQTILSRAEKEGIPGNDVIFDPLAMAVSADHAAGLETLKALRLIGETLSVNLTLGLSNISFGLPDRSAINAIFLAMAAQNGLICPIMDPTDPVMKKALYIAEMILSRDEFCSAYLRYAGKLEGSITAARAQAHQTGDDNIIEALKEAIMAGRKRSALELTEKALSIGIDPQLIVNDALIAGLNTVGERFEKRQIFVPEMMMSAKTMQSCMDIVKPALTAGGEGKGFDSGTVVIGTVFGDLHDIGKNLTKLLLESAGFRVVDLGENVPAERFLDAVRKEDARVVGLSSLLTTGDPHVLDTVRLLKGSDMTSKIKIICGGAALTGKFVVDVCGADAYARDAADGVRKIRELLASGD